MADLLGTYILRYSPEDNFSMTIDGLFYTFRQLWNTEGFWTIDIFDADKVIIISGIRLVAGINLLDQYPVLRFNILIDTDTDPTRDNLELYPLQFYTKD